MSRRRQAALGEGLASVWPQQAVTGEIVTSPQRDPGAIVNRIDRDNRIRICKGNPTRRTCRRRCLQQQLVKQALDLRRSQIVSITTPMQTHVKRDSDHTWQPFEQHRLEFFGELLDRMKLDGARRRRNT